MLKAIAIVLVLVCAGPTVLAQQPPTPASTIRVTKVLAIGQRADSLTGDARQQIMPNEVAATVRLYLDGKIDQWWVRGDGKGVVFLMNVSTVEEAHSLLEKLPLGQAHLMTFEYMPLGPLSPLRYLLPSGSPAK